jgi:hypothetical protein
MATGKLTRAAEKKDVINPNAADFKPYNKEPIPRQHPGQHGGGRDHGLSARQSSHEDHRPRRFSRPDAKEPEKAFAFRFYKARTPSATTRGRFGW